MTDGADALASLHAEVAARLRGVGIAPDTRPFRAHLTLARFRRSPAARARAILAALPPPEIPASLITHATLFESRLSASGASHVALARMPLAAG